MCRRLKFLKRDSMILALKLSVGEIRLDSSEKGKGDEEAKSPLPDLSTEHLPCLG